MTDPAAVAAGASSAGAMLRAAREHRGLSVAALAAMVKVAPARVEALEADRMAELPDLAFARGLARSLCRLLDIDAVPVLALMPPLPGAGPGLERMHNGLDAPLRWHGAESAVRRQALRRPGTWLALLLLLLLLGAALLADRMPEDWAARLPVPERAGRAPATVSEQVPVPQAPPPDAVAAPFAAAAPPVVEAPPPAASTPASAAPLLRLRAEGNAWIEVRDAGGRVLVRRRLQAGEALEVEEGTPPLRARIGNVSAVQLSFRGEPVDLVPSTRDNVARLELK